MEHNVEWGSERRSESAVPWEWGSVFCMILVNSSSILSTSVRIHPRTLKGCNTKGRLRLCSLKTFSDGRDNIPGY